MMDEPKERNVFNPMGYKINVSHPRMRSLYDRYKRWKGIAPGDPLTHEQRKEFEAYVLRDMAAGEVPPGHEVR